MKVLITGATGLVGSELTKILLQNGVEVHYLTTSKSKLENQEFYKGFYWNPLNGEINKDAFEGVTTIIHLAGESISQRWTKKNKQAIIESRVLPIRLLHHELSKNPYSVTHFISASAIGIYPHSFEKVYTEEEQEIDNSFLGNVVAKWEDETNTIQNIGIEVTKVRIGLVLSKNGGALPQLIKPIKLGVGAFFGSGKQYQSWIHIYDLANLFYYLIHEKLTGTFNAVSPYPITNKELTKAIAKQLEKPLFLPNIPKIVMQLILGEMHYLLFASQNVSARKILNQKFQFKYPTIEKALQNLL